MTVWSVQFTLDRPYGAFEVNADSKTEAAMKAAEWLRTAEFENLRDNLYDDQREDLELTVEDITPVD